FLLLVICFKNQTGFGNSIHATSYTQVTSSYRIQSVVTDSLFTESKQGRQRSEIASVSNSRLAFKSSQVKSSHSR
ncbi:hypothetical protein, partial [Vibrio harveyi]|uniref:hypothetical protein n=1 Tax=Vibrio harveyi TaxID=669 RepID=UPI002ADF882D